MRIFTLIFLSAISSLSLSAQEKGDVLIGGSLNFYRQKTNIPDAANKTSNFTLAPSAGKFYRNNRLAGISLFFDHSSNSQDKEFNRNYYGGGFYLRQYRPLGKSFYLFAEESINGWTAKYKELYNYLSVIGHVKEMMVNLNFSPGIAYGLNKRLQLELGLSQLVSLDYSHKSTRYEPPAPSDKSSSSTLSLHTGFNETALGNLAFGIRWMIDGKK